MKKRTLVCFLIFTLCVFYSSIPGTVFGQDDPSLAQQVYDEYSETLLREDLQDLVDQVLTALSDPATLEKAKPTIDLLFGGDFGKALGAILASPILIRQVVPDADDSIIELLTNDPAIRDFLSDPDVSTLLQDAEAVKELKGLLDEGAPVDPVDPAPPTLSIATSRPTTEQSGSFNVVFATTDANQDPVTVTGSIAVEPVDAAAYYSIPSGTFTGSVRVTQAAPTTEMPTIPGATVTLTLTANDGTADSSPATFVLTFATVEKPPDKPPMVDPPDKPPVKPPTVKPTVNPFDPIASADGKLRLGGLSLNRIQGRQFIAQLIEQALPAELPVEGDALVDPLVDFILAQVPQGFLPKKQIKQSLSSQQPFSIFEKEAAQLDHENFGNAITPDYLGELIYTNVPTETKYLTSDSLHVYARYPSADIGGVRFSLTDGRTVEGQKVTPEVPQADSIPYTFRLEETLAATNLPAWPALGEGAHLFSSVFLRYSDTGLAGPYVPVVMDRITQEDGSIVWETDQVRPELGSIHYYFEVKLTEPVTLEILDLQALDEAFSNPGQISVGTKTHTIMGWSMPDPRNIQLVDRGIFAALFNGAFRTEIGKIVASPDVIALGLKAVSGEEVSVNEILKAIPPQQLMNLQRLLLINAEALIADLQLTFNPMLASVFSVPKVDLESESIWVANFDFDGFDENSYYLEALVYDSEGNPLDQIQEDFTVDTSAPKAGIKVTSGNNVSAYEDGDIFVVTAPNSGAATLNITATPENLSELGVDKGYLILQMIKLDKDGNPHPEGTWLPLGIESMMLASDIWDEVKGQLSGNPNPIADLASTLPLGGILNFLTVDLIQKNAGPFLKPFGIPELTPELSQELLDLIGAVVEDINLVPLIFDASKGMTMTMPIQGENMDLLVGDYGIRAMGIDNLFNVGSYEPPAMRIKIVPPEFDKTSVTVVSIGDLNDDGDPVPDTPHKTGTIYSNTLNDVTLTVTVTERTEHPATAMVQYMDANGDWQDIGGLDGFTESQAGDTLPFKWENLTAEVFDELIMAGETVKVRAVATNDLTRGLTPPDAPVEFEIKLDAGLHPPEVLAIMVDPMSILKTNPDSGAPQGTIVINGYTPVLTGPETESVRFEAKRPGDEDWEVIGEATEGMEFAVEADDLENPIGPPDTYHQWSITVDTATLNEGDGDTITKDSPGARQDYIFNEITNRYEVVDGYVVVDDNKYEVRAVAISMDKLEWSSDARTNFSVDNVDDVAPRGLTHVSVTNLKAFSDSDKVFIDRLVEVAEDGSYTVGGLVDRHDAAVDSPVVTFTITPQAPLGTYELVRLVPLDFPENTVRVEVTETEEVGVFEVAIFDIGTLIDDDELADNDEYVKNGPYMFHALAFDEFENVQEDMSATDGTLITVNVANTRRPAPGVLAITIDDPTPNPDSGAPSGVITFNGYTPNPTSAPTQKIRFEIKRQDDEEWTLVRIDAGVDKRQDAVEVELEPILPGIDIAKTKDMEHPYPVAWPEMYYRWSVDFDTTFLTDTITADSPAARDHTKDENAYLVRAVAIDGTERAVEGVIANLSIDNIDDVAPLGPTNIVINSIDDVNAVDPVFMKDDDGNYTVGGLVDKHDDAVNSPVITLTITPTAERRTYDNVRLISTLEGTLISEPMETVVATETAEGSGVFEVTVDIGTLIDNETYLANGPYMFHALVSDENHPFHPEIVNEQEDMSDTDGSKITVNVANNRRPAPGVLALTVDNTDMLTNPDSGAPQGTITINGYTPDPTSAPMMQVQFEVKRDADAEWISVGMADMSEAAVEAELMPIVADIDAAKAKDMVHPYPVTWPEAYHRWSIEVDTTTLEDSITKDNPGARDVSLDDNPYMVRATAVATDGVERSVEGVTAMFSVDNDDDVAPLGPTNVVATSIDAVDPVFVDNGDGTYTVGGLVDKYDLEVNSPVVTFTITPTAVRKTYASVKLLTTLPEGAIISDITETAEGSGVFTVTIDVGTLMDGDEFVHNDVYLDPEDAVYMFQVHALAYDKAMSYDDATAADAMFLEYGNIQADTYDGDEITVNVENTYRPDPGVIAISVVNSDGMVNPDSGAPQGELTFNVYTYYITSPPTEGIRVEVKRPIDDTWERITGTAIDPVEVDVSDVPGVADLDDITGGLVGITQAGTVSGEQSEVEIPTRYMKWTFIVDTRELALEDTVTSGDTIKLDDTINRGDGDSERDVSLDANQYEVRAISLTPKNLDQTEYPQRDGVEASFSLDNVDDVPPLGPTNITDIADVAGSIAANEDGSVTVGGIVDPTVPSPIAIFTIQPTADPITYVGGKTVLVQTAPDGTVTETDGSLDEGSITIDVGQLANGMYMYHALVADELGNVQVQGEADMPSPVITVHVLNFRVSDISNLMVTSVDGEMVDGELPERIPLRESIAVSFNVANGSLAVEELTGVLVDGHEVTYAAGGEENAFSLMADKLSEVVDGWYTPHGRVTKRNGSVTFALAMINLDNTGPMITIGTPAEGSTVNDLPTLLGAFQDGELGSGVSAENTAIVSLARLRPEEVVQDAVPIDVDQSMVEQDIDSVVYTRTDRLAGGAYMFTIQVSDILGNIGEQTVTFAIEGINPTVVITAPASGQEFDASPASITGFFAGGGDVNITEFTINDADVTAEVNGNNFTYMLAETLAEGDHTVAVEVTDGSGLTAQTSLTFTVKLPVPTVSIDTPTAGQTYDHGKPIITGDFSGADPVEVVVSVDGEAVEAVVDDNAFTYTPADALSHGEHMVAVKATDANGRTAETSIVFTVDIPGPSVAIHSPAAGQMYDHGMPVISVESSGVAEPVTVSVTIDGEAATANEDGTYSPATALGDGEYTVAAIATDANGKTAEATVIFSVGIPGPSVAIHSPAAGQMYDHGMPVISVESSGVAEPVTVSVTIDGEAATANEDGTYSPATALGDGKYTVVAIATDANGKTAEATVIFSVGIPGPSVAIHSPAAGQMYDHGMPVISVESSGVAEPVTVSVTIDGEAATANEDGTYSPATALGDGKYTVAATATDANGKTADATVVFSVRLPVPTVSIDTPAAGQIYDHGKPAIAGDFSGAGTVEVSLSIDGDAVDAVVNENNEFTYTPADALSDGEHMIAVMVTDANGRTAETSAVFTVDIPGPSVAIHSPAAGQMYDHGMPVISVESSGVAEPVTVSVTIDGEAATANEDGTYSPATALGDGEYTVAATATDANGKTADATVVFSVRLPVPTVSIDTPAAGQIYDHGKPAIAGDFSGAGTVEVSLSIDGDAVDAVVNENNEFTYTPADALSDGEHMIAVMVTDANGRTAETSAVFTVDIPGPSVAIHSPAAGQMYDHGMPVISVESSGVAEPVTVSVTIDGEAATANEDGTYSPATALGDGEYTVAATATDVNGKTADATVVFSVRLPVPTVSIDTPAAGQIYDHGKPAIAGDFSGAGTVEVSLSIDGDVVDAVVNENNEFTYTPADALSHGEHMVTVKATDANGRTAETSIVFTVDIPGPSVAIHSPAAGQMYDHGEPVITGEFSGTADVELTTFTINGEAAEAAVEGNAFAYTPDPRLDDGEYTVVAEVTDANGKTADATVVFSVRLPVPTVSIDTPAAGQIYDHGKPAIAGDFSGAGTVEVSLSIDGDAVDAVVNDNNQFTYTPADALSDGGHTVAVEVTDANGRTAETSVVFTVDIPGPAVAILSPAPGQTYDDGKPVIRVEYSGMTDVEVTTFTVNGEDVEVEPEDNQFAYTPANALETGEYHVVVEVTDENEKTAQAAVVFNVKIDNTPPVISEVSPSGVVKFNQQDVLDEKFGIILSAVITDEQSTISSVQFGIVDFGVTKRPLRSVSAQQIAEGKIEVTESFVPGTHTIRLIATSQGGTTEHSWRLTVEVDKDAPVISSITPAGTIHAGLPTISVSATDGSGVSEITIVVMDSNGEVVEGETQDDDEDRTNAGITRLDFNPEAPLSEGSYSIEVRATDTFGNSSTAKGGFSIDFDTAAPIITSSSPQNGARLMYKHDEEARPVISVTFGDAETGVNADSIRFVIESPKVGGGSQAQPINLSGEQMSATQVIYTPDAPAFPRGFEAPGQYTVTLEVSDNAHQEGNVSDESESARKANTAVYQFTFSVEYSDAPILNKPFNFPNPFKDTTRISFGLTRMSTVSIVIYDTTFRPVRTLRDNVVMPAGNYTGENGIGWDGKTSGGEDLARGIYYCQIIVTDGVEPEYAILKLALTR